jgi:small GTP-binding protein
LKENQWKNPISIPMRAIILVTLSDCANDGNAQQQSQTMRWFNFKRILSEKENSVLYKPRKKYPAATSKALMSDDAPEIPPKGKVVFVGRVNVGKTALMKRITENRFDANTEPTAAAAYGDYHTADGALIQFWDTAGMERYRAINRLYYRDAAVSLLVFDVSDRTSFDDIESWKREVEKEDSTGNIAFILVGNKADITDPAKVQVPEDAARDRASEFGVQYFAVSARTGEGLFELLEAIVQIIAPPIPRAEVQATAPLAIDVLPEQKGCC